MKASPLSGSRKAEKPAMDETGIFSFRLNQISDNDNSHFLLMSRLVTFSSRSKEKEERGECEISNVSYLVS